ncbi:YbbR-like domain-containing protein [Rossellomorea vietnamensis]|uniref:YbbR-like domain-containing protein n=3 Tax=Bacillaceae TaxID=186817 RepID=A0A5D4K983_9BACI|nr:YbbR-like domain-containing protein [Rossellomorea vietnamensis]TYS71668.1 YbbR-like domain-containing protein [Rossellomorea aquimaris]
MHPLQNGAGGGRETMDKFIENRWFMRIVGLLLAFVLYVSVNFDEMAVQRNESSNPQQGIETIENVPVEVFYDSENLFVSGVPETVTIEVDGPKNLVTSAKTLRDFHVYADLNDLGIGDHQVQLKIEGISDKLQVNLDPSFVNVSIQEKVTEEFSVDPEFNEALLAEGYQSESVTVEPRNVEITGAKDIIEQIAYVVATPDVNSGIDASITREARVQVLDRDYNKLDVAIEPETVDVTIEVINPSKEVTVAVNQTGDLPDGLELESITVNPKKVTVFGRDALLRSINELQAELDLSEVTKDTTIEVPLELPEGVNKATPEQVEVTIDIKEVEKKTVMGNTITLEGADEDLEYEFVNPESGAVDITVSGFPEQLGTVDSQSFSLFADVTGLAPGDHEIELTAEGPEDIEWELTNTTVTIQIQEKIPA